METDLKVFVNYEQNDWAKLPPMAKFAYHNAKNASTGHTLFELNCGYHPCIFYEDEVNPRSQSKPAEELATELKELLTVCWENLQHVQDLQKGHHDKNVKLRSYAPGNKVWLNRKYIKTKQNRKLEAKSFGTFRVLHPVNKQDYKIVLSRKWKIHDVFHVSLLEQDINRTGWVDKATSQLEFEGDGDGEKYEV